MQLSWRHIFPGALQGLFLKHSKKHHTIGKNYLTDIEKKYGWHIHSSPQKMSGYRIPFVTLKVSLTA